jgi:hypothetical protein
MLFIPYRLGFPMLQYIQLEYPANNAVILLDIQIIFQFISLKIKLIESYAEKSKMSMGSRNKQPELGRKLVNELRQSYGLGASFFRAAAARIEMTDTDMQVIDILESGGEATAGQLAHLMGAVG